MLRLMARRQGQVSPAGGADQVITGISLPSDTVIHDIRGNFHCLPNTVGVELSSVVAIMYAFECWLLPVIAEFDATPQDFDTIWDNLVPKDSDTQVLDLDVESADASNFYEPGEAEFSEIFDVGLQPEFIGGRYQMLSMANTKGIVFVDSNTPFEPKWQPADMFSVHYTKRRRVSQPSVLLMAFGAVGMDDTTSTIESTFAESGWGQVKYFGDMLKRAMMDVLGLTEAGSETPWEEATDLLQAHLDPDVFEADANAWTAADMRYFGRMTVDHSVVGELGLVSVSDRR